MKKVLRNVLIALLVVVLLWIIFVTIDCVRLRNAKYYTYPLINLKQEANLERVTYTGLGYTISYIQNRTIDYEDGLALEGIGACGAEFKLFNKLLIWAYIE